MFHEGDAVVCIDASDLPPPWHPLVCGKTYVIRSIESLHPGEIFPGVDGNYDKNIHKRARYGVRLWGISNPNVPLLNKELVYADSRFADIDDGDEKEATDVNISVTQNLVLEAA